MNFVAVGASVVSVISVRNFAALSRRWDGDRLGEARRLADVGIPVEHHVVPGQDHYFLDPADLRHDSAVDVLVAGGLSLDRPSLFVLEGLTMYLPEVDVRRLLGDLASAAPGSRLSTDFYPRPDAGSARNRRQDQLQRLAWKFLIPVALANIVVTAILKVVF